MAPSALTPKAQKLFDQLVTEVYGSVPALPGRSADAVTEPGPGFPDFPPVTAVWWRPTDAATEIFAARIGWTVADLNGSRRTDNGTLATCYGDAATAKLYMAFGFNPGGVRMLASVADREKAKSFADYLNDPYITARQAEDKLAGAGNYEIDVLAAALLTDQTSGVTSGSVESPRLNFGGPKTFEDIIAAPPGYTDAGPSGKL